MTARPVWSAPAYSAGILNYSLDASGAAGPVGPSVFITGGANAGAGMAAGYTLAGTNLMADWHYPLQPNAPIGPMVASPVPAVLTDKATGAVDRMVFVTHLAATVGVFNIIESPVATILNNIGGTENVLQMAAKKKKRNLANRSRPGRSRFRSSSGKRRPVAAIRQRSWCARRTRGSDC